MSTEVINSYSDLANELNQAKSSLKHYDENIKRLIGRDPSDPTQRNQKRPPPTNDEFRNRNYDNTNRLQENSFSRQRNQRNYDSEEPPAKKRSMDSSVFKRLDKPRQNDEDSSNKLQMHSRVIVTQREVPSRQDALKAQDRDEKSKARNRRMFGALLGTLQKFRQEETKLKTKEEKRAQVEKKLEEQEVLEKAKVKKERYELFLGRKRKQQEIRIIEQKMARIKEHAFWEEKQKPLANFIRTTAKPCIYYLPRKLTPALKEKLNESKEVIEKSIQTRKEELEAELDMIENKFKKEDPKDLEDGEIEDQDEVHDMLNEELEHTATNIEIEEPNKEEVVVKTEKNDKHIKKEEESLIQDETPKKEEEIVVKETYPVNMSLDDIQIPPEPEVAEKKCDESVAESDQLMDGINPENPDKI